jgi:hypothetical protein
VSLDVRNVDEIYLRDFHLGFHASHLTQMVGNGVTPLFGHLVEQPQLSYIYHQTHNVRV